MLFIRFISILIRRVRNNYASPKKFRPILLVINIPEPDAI